MNAISSWEEFLALRGHMAQRWADVCLGAIAGQFQEKGGGLCGSFYRILDANPALLAEGASVCREIEGLEATSVLPYDVRNEGAAHLYKGLRILCKHHHQTQLFDDLYEDMARLERENQLDGLRALILDYDLDRAQARGRSILGQYPGLATAVQGMLDDLQARMNRRRKARMVVAAGAMGIVVVIFLISALLPARTKPQNLVNSQFVKPTLGQALLGVNNIRWCLREQAILGIIGPQLQGVLRTDKILAGYAADLASYKAVCATAKAEPEDLKSVQQAHDLGAVDLEASQRLIDWNRTSSVP